MDSDEKLKKIFEMINPISKKDVWSDNFSEESIINDFAGGNIDDAFWGGERDGQTQLARQLIKTFYSKD